MRQWARALFNSIILAVALPLAPARADVAPSISGTPPMAVQYGRSYSFTPNAFDPEGQALSFLVVNKPGWAIFDATTGRLYGVPTSSDAEQTFSDIRILVHDGTSITSLPSFSISVTSTNSTPVLTGAPLDFVPVGSFYGFVPKGYDPEGRPLQYQAINKPAWISFDAATGRLSGTPDATLAGLDFPEIRLCATDGETISCLPTFSIRVTPANAAPVIAGVPGSDATVGLPYTFRPSALDPDGNPLSFRISNRPPWAYFDAASGTLLGVPGPDDAAISAPPVTITATDGYAWASLPAFSIRVTGAPAVASTVTLSWRAPTARVDGSALLDLAGFRVHMGPAPDQLTSRLDIPVPTIESATIENLSQGAWYFAVQAYTATGRESDLSEIVLHAVY